MMDFVFPQDNEKEFIAMAVKLGYSSLCLIYKKKKDLTELQKAAKIRLYPAVIFPERGNFVVARAGNDNRALIENQKINLIFDLEAGGRNDFIHHRNSGVNHILCKIAHEKNIIFGLNFSSLICAKGKERSKLIGRMMQNARLCRKYKVKTIIASFASEPQNMRARKDLISFGSLIGIIPVAAEYFK